MKKLFFFLVAMFITVAAFSQARALRVENQTNCVQYYTIFGDDLCKCGDKVSSNVIAINPGNVHTYGNSLTLGGTYSMSVPMSIVGAKIAHGPANCQPQAGTVGEQSCGLPPIYTFMALNQDCRECARTNARWITSSGCGQARLIFTP